MKKELTLLFVLRHFGRQLMILKNQHKTYGKEKKVQMTKIKGFKWFSYDWLYFGQSKHSGALSK